MLTLQRPSQPNPPHEDRTTRPHHSLPSSALVGSSSVRARRQVRQTWQPPHALDLLVCSPQNRSSGMQA